MQKKSFFKDLKRSIIKSKARFFSIMAMIALGVGFFAGINATKPDMILSADTYYKDYNLSNFRVMSPLGFKEEDILDVKSMTDVESVMESYIKDAFLSAGENQGGIIKVYSFDEKKYEDKSLLNVPMIESGRLPQNSGEIALDTTLNTMSDVQLGDKVTLSVSQDEELTDSFKRSDYEVVGFIKSPLYITYERGQTNIGDGSVAFYGYISESDFNMEKVTDLFIKTKESDNLLAYSKEYKAYNEPTKDSLDTLGREVMNKETLALQSELKDGEAELLENKAKAEQELADGEKKLQDAEAEIVSGEQELNDNEAKYTQQFKEKRDELKAGKAALATGKAQYKTGYNQWLAGFNEFKAGEAKLASSKAELDAAKAQLDAGEATLLSTKTDLDRAKSQIDNLQASINGLKSIRDSISPTTALTEDEYLALIASISLYSPELGTNLTAGIPFGDPNLNVKLIAALDSSIAQSETLLVDAKGQYEGGLQQYDTGVKALEESKLKYEGGLAAYNEGAAKLESSRTQIEAAKQKLDDSKALLDSNEKKLADGEAALNKGEVEFKTNLKEGREKIASAKVELAEGRQTFETEKADALLKIADAETEIKDAKRMLLEIPSEWFVYTRDGNPGYTGMGDDASRIGAVAKVFPLFFFLVAALVCLTTMTRMVEEERIQIGTLKALGYSTFTIAMKYLTYSLLASLIGSIIGFTVGFQLFPRLIIFVYGSMYATPYIMSPFHFDLALISTGIAVVTTVSASLFATLNELRETPAVLMQPKAPKPGKRILLERIKPLWKRLSFSYKVTFRNIFRYKKRLLMTVIGIAGCTALLVTAFGISDSVGAIMGKQFDEIFIYDGMAILNTDKDESLRNLDEILGKEPEVKSYVSAHSETITAHSENSDREYEVSLMAPLNTETFKEFYDLHDRGTKEPIELTEDGAVITEKLANMLGVGIGDSMTYTDTDNHIYQFRVEGITENYLSHYIFMSPAYYDKITLREPEINTGLFTFKDPENTDLSAFKEKLMENEGVLGSMIVATIQEEFGSSLDSLDYVVLILILAAGALAFVVLYNLTNINITERIREIATIKVLGFRNKEVSAYIYRENVFLTLIGTFVGLFLGLILHKYVMGTMEVDNMMFGRIISFMSFVYAIALTMGFSFLVNWVMFYKLKKVNMVESLKSIE
ncbi:MAG: FtsX-like permease family protein [Clostridiaceae bacterium]